MAIAENDLASEIAELAENAGGAVSNVIYLTGEKDGIKAEIALVYTDGWTWNSHSYVNNFETRVGGSHCDGFRAGLAEAYNKFLKERLQKEEYSAKIKINCDDAAKRAVCGHKNKCSGIQL